MELYESVLVNQMKMRDTQPGFQFKFEPPYWEAAQQELQDMLNKHVRREFHSRAFVFGEYLLETVNTTEITREMKEKVYIVVNRSRSESKETNDPSVLICHPEKFRYENGQHVCDDEYEDVEIRVLVASVQRDQAVGDFFEDQCEQILPFNVCYRGRTRDFYYSTWYQSKRKNMEMLSHSALYRYDPENIRRLWRKGFNTDQYMNQDGKFFCFFFVASFNLLGRNLNYFLIFTLKIFIV